MHLNKTNLNKKTKQRSKKAHKLLKQKTELYAINSYLTSYNKYMKTSIKTT